jgi:hypothetical protein
MPDCEAAGGWKRVRGGTKCAALSYLLPKLPHQNASLCLGWENLLADVCRSTMERRRRRRGIKERRNYLVNTRDIFFGHGTHPVFLVLVMTLG